MSDKIIIEVQAGIVLGQPLPELTKRFTLSDHDCQNPDLDMVIKTYGHATEYARFMMHPGRYNWVKFEWIYL